jgi:hypothetical protein
MRVAGTEEYRRAAVLGGSEKQQELKARRGIGAVRSRLEQK